MDFLLNITIALVIAAVSLTVLYFVIKEAVLAALREHTLNSTTAVMIKQSIPLEVKAPVSE